MEILEKQVLEMSNVLSVRAKMNKQMHAKITKDIERLIKENHAVRNGCSVSATFSVEQGVDGLIMDCEILIPLDKKFAVPQGFKFKDKFLLTNAVKITHYGNPAGIQKTVDELNKYIFEHKLMPISTGYNVTTKEAKTPLDIDDTEIDIYVSVSPNSL